MLFYYNGLQVAKSTKRIYTHAITRNNWVISVHTSKANAEKSLRQKRREMDLRKYNLEKAIEAKKNYKEYAIYKYPCGKRHKTILLGSYEDYTQKLNEIINNIHATYCIVELEQK